MGYEAKEAGMNIVSSTDVSLILSPMSLLSRPEHSNIMFMCFDVSSRPVFLGGCPVLERRTSNVLCVPERRTIVERAVPCHSTPKYHIHTTFELQVLVAGGVMYVLQEHSQVITFTFFHASGIQATDDPVDVPRALSLPPGPVFPNVMYWHILVRQRRWVLGTLC